MAVAIPLIALALTAVGTGVGTYAAVQQGNAADDAAKFNAKVAQNEAQNEATRTAFEASQIRRKNLIRSGDQRAAYAKAGVDLSGSATDVLFDTGIQGELEAMGALYGGAMASASLRSRARLSVLEGQNAQTAGYLSAGSTLLTGGARGATTYYENTFPSFRRN